METDPLLREQGYGRFRHYHVEHEEPLPGLDSACIVDTGLQPHAHLPVYDTIHRIRAEVISLIDDPYSLKQLRDPRTNTSVVRPLVDKYYELKDVSIVFCLLVNRMQFRSEQTQQSHEQSINLSRAILCELVATRILRRFHEDNPGQDGLLLLANVLVTGFSPFQGAPVDVQRENLPEEHWAAAYKSRHPALELAIVAESKMFLSSGACQLVVNAIYIGRIVYTPTTFIDIIPDHYKYRPISLYDPRKAPLLNQYRLMVPRTRNLIEVFEFITLLGLYVWVMMWRPAPHEYPLSEILFSLYACGWILELFAAVLEHGWFVYTQNLWSFLDVMFSVVFGVYAALRLHGFHTKSPVPGQQALDVLAVAATVLIPRLAFNLMSENMLFVSLRAMMKDFTVLTVLAAWCFVGFLLSLLWLGEGKHNAVTLSKWMLWVWFGLDGTGIGRSSEFHWLLGPVLMVAYAFLGYLFLVVLVSMLSTTFSTLHTDASAEIQFRRAVLTLEGVKSDAIFSYLPPLNLFAMAVLLPLKFVITPRWFHKINVATIRILNLPTLLLLAGAATEGIQDAEAPRAAPANETANDHVHGDLQAVFRAESDRIIQEEMDGGEVVDVPVPPSAAAAVVMTNDAEYAPSQSQAGSRRTVGSRSTMLQRSGTGMTSIEGTTRKTSRRDSVMPFGEMADHLRVLLGVPLDDDGSEATRNIGQRMNIMEERLRNIEDMLGQLVGSTSRKAWDASEIPMGMYEGQ
ncbi:hypothetical protein DRE_04819 [Drechslerella stenobrocha 248]|uniref:Ion transport domain-containing protein n=1 Tax=Drechslerella stenobrocha 248 TaxID=1043628 RepID=W7HPJ1_9PEZI|nr:hypothetical protein DRE_04819 [Drechslerella stenobrocha 248]